MSVSQPALSTPEILDRLQHWPIGAAGLHPGGSNYVFVVKLDPPDLGSGDESIYAVYKPQAGERPLRDFPPGGLFKRERAAYLLSQALGWPAIPPTVTRDGPHGPGSVQLYVDALPDESFFTMRNDDLNAFEPVAAFDVLALNADRKGGSCLKDDDGAVWCIDHGLTFNPFARQRTVMLEFSGRAFSGGIVRSLKELAPRLAPTTELSLALDELLFASEPDALRERLSRLIETPVFPVLDPQMNVPWPYL